MPLFLISPLLAWLAGGLILSWAKKPRATLLWTLIGFLPIAFALHSSRAVLGDWQWYQSQYTEYPRYDLVEIFGSTFHPQNQVEEPLYYSVSWLLSHTTNANLGALVGLIIVAIYGALTAAVWLLTRELGLTTFQMLGMHYFVFGFGINFSIATHLVRQSIAETLLFLAFALMFSRKLRAGVGFVFLAVMVHTPSLVPGFFLMIIFWTSLTLRANIYILASSGLALGVTYWVAQGYRYDSVSDGAVSPLMLLSYIFLALWLSRIPRSNLLKWDLGLLPGRLASFLVLMLSFVCGTFLEPIPSLRFFHYIEPFFGLAIWLASQYAARHARVKCREVCATVAMFILAVGAIEVRILSSPLGFTSGIVAFLGSGVAWPFAR